MKKHTLAIEDDGKDLFVVFDGVKIAKRGQPGTAQEKRWISLEPGYQVNDVLEDGEDAIEVLRDGVPLVH